MSKNKFGFSLDKQEEILNFLKSDCPEIFSEGKVDCKKLKQTLGEKFDDSNERYGLSWAGKSNCFKVIQEQTTATLKPAKDESVDFDQTQNLFIEGDNLEVLKVLQRSYYGKVKMIYIDPPYNTGNDFIYNDNFRKSKKDEMAENGEADENGDLTRVDGLALNRKDSNGHFHSDWLNMMYPRLFLARNLLKQDGVVFVSIDDNEVKNLRMIMDEIFGEENFIGDIIWNSTKSVTNTALISVSHTYNLIYAKNIQYYIENRNEFRLKETGDGFSNPDNDPRGVWKADPFQVGGWRPNQQYEIKNPKTGEIYTPNPAGSWKNDLNKFQELLKDNRIVFGVSGDAGPQRKRFLSEALERGRVTTTLWSDIETTTNGTQLLKKILGGNYFDNPKPVSLIKRFAELCTKNDDIILDFFAGSGTTAHAVMELNSKDGGNRKWICVQLPEFCDEKSEAYKAGYKTIAEIGKERIRRAGKKIEKESENKIDLGFKVLKLDKSNFKIWQGKFKNTENLLSDMADFVDNVNKGSKEENILTELILKSGLDLNVSIQKKAFGDDSYYLLDDGKLIVYLGKEITKEIAEAIQKSKPEKFICLDGCFQNNDQLKTNISLQMEQEKIDFKVI